LLFGAFTHALQSCTGLLAVAHWSRTHQARDFLAMAGNRDFFALLDEVDNWPSLFFASKPPISRTDKPHVS
jgi:hypothetical protein